MGRQSFAIPNKEVLLVGVKHQNELVLLALNCSLDFDLLHAYEINLLRPDDHYKKGDCLHSCLPEKVAVYNQVLLHLMLLNQQDEIASI